MTYDRLFLPFFSPLYISLIDLANTLQIFNYKIIYALDDKHVNNYYCFIGIQLLLLFLIYKIQFISSWAWKLKSKVALVGNSTNFFKIYFLNAQKIKYRINVVFFFQNHDLLLKEISISNKLKKFTAKTILHNNIYLIWYRYAYPRFHINVRNPR